jgi:D-sedoheptulose 7-phosphate isomerase
VIQLVDDGPAGARRHLAAVRRGLTWLEGQVAALEAWAAELAGLLPSGGRLLVAGNGGSAALAQHLTAELVGRYLGERPAFSAICLNADMATLTALGNDYGFEESFARQVAGHGRPGDVFLGLSTSGRSPNVVRAAEVAGERGLRSWALTGPGPNPLTERSHAALAVEAASTATVQELHQIAVHLLCAAFDEQLDRGRRAGRAPFGRAVG